MTARNDRIPKKGGAEWDCFSGWRKVMAYLDRAGAKRSIRRQYNRRRRSMVKQQLRENLLTRD